MGRRKADSVELDPKPRTIGQIDCAVFHRKRRLHDILGEIKICQAHAPVYVRHCARKMNRSGGADARFGDLCRDVDLESELLAQLACSERFPEPTELDELQRHTLRARAPHCLDVGE